jgi:ribosomal protein S12 methylthiotransferase
MRRGITRRKTIEIVDQIRQKVPDICLRTTMLVGHPGETEQDFDQLVEFVQQTKFDRLGVFQYSHEENTHAGTLEDIITAEVKEMRAEQLMEVQRDISMQKNLLKIGKTYKVLVDRHEGNHWIGRTEYDSPEVDNEVLIDASSQFARLGDFCQVEITDAMEYDLFGKIVE